VLEFIASKISRNIRELEGALIRVTAFASLNRQTVDLSLAEVVLKDLIPADGGPEITGATIMAATAEYFGLTMEDLCGSSRSRVLVTARQIADVPVPRAHRPVAARRSGRCSAAATTPPSSTPTARSAARCRSGGPSTTRSPSSTNRIKTRSAPA
jgi:hypothetical protein